MHILSFAENLDMALYLIIFVTSGVMLFFIFRNFTFDLYDPLWINIMAITFCTTTIIYTWLIDQTTTSRDFQYFIAALCAFIIGNYCAKKSLINYLRKPAYLKKGYESSKFEQKFIVNFLKIATALLIFSLILKYLSVGLPIFSTDPESQKVLTNRNGFGIFSRFIDPLTYCCLLVIYYDFFKNKKKVNDLIYSHFFHVSLFSLLASGSKGSLLTLFIAFYIAKTYISLRMHSTSKAINNKVIFLVVLLVIGYAFLVLGITAIGSGITDIATYITNMFFVRMIAFSDGVFYFFTNETLNSNLQYSPYEYFRRYLIVPFLAPIRILPYDEQTLGVEIAKTLFGVDNFGPNPTFWIEGLVFFGYWGGLIYSWVIGYLLIGLRIIGLAIKTSNNIIGLIIFGTFNLLAFRCTFDMLLFASSVFDFGTVITTLMIISIILTRRFGLIKLRVSFTRAK